MIKVFVRAIVPTNGHYVLMGETDKNNQEIWDLPGGELKPGLDVKQYLRKLVLETTGYTINNLQFFEIACRVRRSARGVDPATAIEFVFTSHIEAVELQEGTKLVELLPYEKFEWLDSGGHFRENKVMALLNKFHRRNLRQEEEARKREEEEKLAEAESTQKVE